MSVPARVVRQNVPAGSVGHDLTAVVSDLHVLFIHERVSALE